MTPDQFIAKWKDATLKERSAAQEHFIDLCRLLEVPTPAEADPTGTWYCFEKGAKKTSGGDGWADVWKRHCYGMEYKGKGKDLQKAFMQLQGYTPALEYPPLLIVSDIARIVIHTAFTGTVPEVHVILLEDLRDAAKRRLLKWAFTEPERLRPGQTTAALTEAAAGRFGDLALALRARGHDPWATGHFCIRLLFCLFAEDIDLLPGKLFTRLLEAGLKHPENLPAMLENLFGAMATGGMIGFEPVDWFNGGLFDSPATLPLEVDDIKLLRELARLDWSAIEPSIFGTLFERGLDPDKRSQLGAHYTDPGSIMRLVDPVVLDPLRDAWTDRKAEIETLMAKAAAAKSPAARTRAQTAAHTVLQGFLHRLASFRVLDPACGSGNFLLLVLQGLKDLEHRVSLEAEAQGLPRAFPLVGPECVLGIELNPYAAELARVTVWIGEIQWMLSHGFSLSKQPILKPLNTIEQRDAILNPDGTEPEWPAADVIVGNPPFLGGSKKRGTLGDAYFAALDRLYAGRVPAGADLVTYWFEKARAQIVAGKAGAAGLVATNSIRGGANRTVLERIQRTEIRADHGESHDKGHIRYAGTHGQTQGGGCSARTGGDRGSSNRRGAVNTGDEGRFGTSTRPAAHRSGRAEMDDGDTPGGGDVARPEGIFLGEPCVGSTGIFNAWSDEPWINEGAAVRVSLVAFCRSTDIQNKVLDGRPVADIHPDLTPGSGLNDGDLTTARGLADNADVCFMGASKKGPFDIPGELARSWLRQPNPHGQSNAGVLRPLWNGIDLTRRDRDRWIVDFGTAMQECEAALYEAPFAYVLERVKPIREANNRETYRRYWWRHAEARPGMRAALDGLPRYIATPHVSKHRLFVSLQVSVLPDQMLLATARADDTTFGILHSRFHELWSLRMCTWIGKGNDPRYTPTTTFETFPFPFGLTPADTAGPTEPLDSGVILPTVAPDHRPAALAIAEAAYRLNALREHWLNPPEWVERVPEVVPGYPDRIIPRPEYAAELKKRTLTNLYNARPTWLDNAHQALDQAVAAAYGWPDYTVDTPDAEILRRLLALNLERAAACTKPTP